MTPDQRRLATLVAVMFTAATTGSPWLTVVAGAAVWWWCPMRPTWDKRSSWRRTVTAMRGDRWVDPDNKDTAGNNGNAADAGG